MTSVAFEFQYQILDKVSGLVYVLFPIKICVFIYVTAIISEFLINILHERYLIENGKYFVMNIYSLLYI